MVFCARFSVPGTIRICKARQLSRGDQLGPLVKQFPNQVPGLWDHLDSLYGDEVAE